MPETYPYGVIIEKVLKSNLGSKITTGIQTTFKLLNDQETTELVQNLKLDE